MLWIKGELANLIFFIVIYSSSLNLSSYKTRQVLHCLHMIYLNKFTNSNIKKGKKIYNWERRQLWTGLKLAPGGFVTKETILSSFLKKIYSAEASFPTSNYLYQLNVLKAPDQL